MFILMERKPLTLRLDPPLYKALSSLSKITHRSMNQIASQALSKFVAQESKAVARDLEETLRKLKQYSDQDPGFEKAISAVAESEIQYDDPLESSVDSADSDARSKLRELLNAS